MSDTRTDPAVWLLWTGIEEDRMIHSIYGSRDGACHALCDLVLRGRELTHPKIERKVVKGTTAINAGNVDAVAAVISAVRAMNSRQKTDIQRASLARLWTALEALAYPGTVPIGIPAGSIEIDLDPPALSDLDRIEGR
jgi:hypothetical protein